MKSERIPELRTSANEERLEGEKRTLSRLSTQQREELFVFRLFLRLSQLARVSFRFKNRRVPPFIN